MAVVELGLRLAGAFDVEPLFVPVEGAEGYLTPNPNVGHRYFTGPVVPGPPHDAFRAAKPEREFRLVVQGGSSAAGFPYGRTGTFPRMLEQRLTRTFPDRRVEVINTGIDAVSSWTLVDLADDIREIEPDAVLVYAGHNEFFGVFGAASTQGRVATRLYLTLKRFRIVGALSSLWAGMRAEGATTSPDQSLMGVLAAGQRVRFGSKVYQDALRQFEDNLTRLTCGYREAAIPVFLATVASNERDQAPFDPGPHETPVAEWREDVGAAREAAAVGDSARSSILLAELIARDPSAAGVRFDLARLEDHAGRMTEAAAGYAAARDRDGLPFRAPSEINDVIRRVAGQCGAALVDARAAIAAASPDAIPGASLFLEHLHPNVDGYFVLADAFYGALEAAALPEPWTARIPAAAARREVLVTELDTLLAAVHVRRLTSRWPFDTTNVSPPDTLPPEGMVAQLADDVIAGRRSWSQAMSELGAWHTESGRTAQALQIGLALIQEYPYSREIHVVTADLLRGAGALSQALLVYQEADRISPSSATRRMVGQMQLRTGRAEESVGTLRSARAMPDSSPGVLYDLALALLSTGQPEEAARIAEELIVRDPDYPSADRLLEQARSRAGLPRPTN
ncbi:MAG: hypothetical protein HKN29_05405 [Rhodothermales bacterium]|nr:hypothetical protein [Rhodothermales bacterium]